MARLQKLVTMWVNEWSGQQVVLGAVVDILSLCASTYTLTSILYGLYLLHFVPLMQEGVCLLTTQKSP